MQKKTRQPQDVVGWNPELLAYWDTMPGNVRIMLLDSQATVSTLGELKMMEAHFGNDVTKMDG